MKSRREFLQAIALRGAVYAGSPLWGMKTDSSIAEALPSDTADPLEQVPKILATI